MTLEGIKVAVAMKKVMAPGYTEGRDDRVNCAARRYAARSERAMVAGGGDCDLIASHRPKLKSSQSTLRDSKVALEGKALKYFCHDQIANHELRRGNPTKDNWSSMTILVRMCRLHLVCSPNHNATHRNRITET